MISVVIPTYNREVFLAAALESVCSQDFRPVELIIVDDGSTDNSRQIVLDTQQETDIPIRYVHQLNSGAAAARNTGIRQAEHDIICFLDSDDRFLPGKLTRQLKEMAASDCRVSHTRETWLRRGRPLQQKKKHQPPRGDIFKASLRMCVVGMSTVMIHRSVFDDFGLFDESLPCCEDYEFWLRVATRETYHLVDEPFTLKNGGRPDQLSVRYRTGMDRYRIRALVRLLQLGELNEDQGRWALAELERKCRIYGEGCRKHGRPEEGEGILAIPGRFRQERHPSGCQSR